MSPLLPRLPSALRTSTGAVPTANSRRRQGEGRRPIAAAEACKGLSLSNVVCASRSTCWHPLSSRRYMPGRRASKDIECVDAGEVHGLGGGCSDHREGTYAAVSGSAKRIRQHSAHGKKEGIMGDHVDDALAKFVLGIGRLRAAERSLEPISSTPSQMRPELRVVPSRSLDSDTSPTVACGSSEQRPRLRLVGGAP